MNVIQIRSNRYGDLQFKRAKIVVDPVGIRVRVACFRLSADMTCGRPPSEEQCFFRPTAYYVTVELMVRLSSVRRL